MARKRGRRPANGTSMKAILTVAGSDSSAGAGIQADLKTIAAHGAYAMTAVTAVTAQNARGVRASMPVPVEVVAAQLDAAFETGAVAAVKTGMLVDRARVGAVARSLRRRGAPHYVLDPVITSSSGHVLLEDDAVAAVLDELAPLAELVTPNVPEIERMTGLRVRTLDDARAAAAALLDRGCRAVLVKGGHLDAAPATDLLATPRDERVFPGKYVPTEGAGGTGCTYSAAIATHLGHGVGLLDAIERAKRFVTAAIANGPALGAGPGPMDHFHAFRDPHAEDHAP